jgi:hypothetical protein
MKSKEWLNEDWVIEDKGASARAHALLDEAIRLTDDLILKNGKQRNLPEDNITAQ